MIRFWTSSAAARHGLITTSAFRNREWLAEQSKGGSLTTYVFRAGEAGAVVGYAAVSFRNQPHPDDASSSKAKVLVISMLGVDQAFKAKAIPRQRVSPAPLQSWPTSKSARNLDQCEGNQLLYESRLCHGSSRPIPA
jgi:hypothetical protein